MSQQPKTAASTDALTLNTSACLAALKPLARAGAHLAPFNSRCWVLYSRETSGAPSGGKLPVPLVMELEKVGLIAIGRGGLGRLNQKGRAWLKRHLASPAPEVRHHQMRQVQAIPSSDGHSDEVLMNLSESPLVWLRKRRDGHGKAMISEVEFEAGERLRRDFTKAQLMPKVTASWSGACGPARNRRKNGLRTNDEQNLSDAACAARARVAAAMSAVGPEFETLLLDTCCFLRGFEASETSYGWPRRSAKLVLKLALGALARHYGEGGADACLKPPGLRRPLRGCAEPWPAGRSSAVG
ncbi:MAG: hypothetical protein GY948_22165 [Alphaproteobacteria bacterium]|nr:hypothetical protein [Alphaproteobacteria bacterium]